MSWTRAERKSDATQSGSPPTPPHPTRLRALNNGGPTSTAVPTPVPICQQRNFTFMGRLISVSVLHYGETHISWFKTATSKKKWSETRGKVSTECRVSSSRHPDRAMERNHMRTYRIFMGEQINVTSSTNICKHLIVVLVREAINRFFSLLQNVLHTWVLTCDQRSSLSIAMICLVVPLDILHDLICFLLPMHPRLWSHVSCMDYVHVWRSTGGPGL